MSSNVFEEFFNFFNALLIGPPDEEDVNDDENDADDDANDGENDYLPDLVPKKQMLSSGQMTATSQGSANATIC